MRPEDLVRLRHMLDAADEACGFAENRNRKDLDTDRQLVLSLVKDLEIIGEAASKVSDECKTVCADIPWNDVVTMRHRLVHAYFDINLNIVWKTVQEDLPELLSKLEKIISS
jgi:uncharacterized protein with HEPN domain